MMPHYVWLCVCACVCVVACVLVSNASECKLTNTDLP